MGGRTDGEVTPQEAVALVRSIDVSRFPLRMTIAVESVDRWKIHLRVDMVVPDRDVPGARRRVSVTHRYPLHYGAEYLLRTIVTWLRSVVLHEFDELLMVDGVRMFDPHDDARRLPGAHP